VRADRLYYRNLASAHKREKCVPLDAIEQLLAGPTSDVFQRNGLTAHSSDGARCFSLVFGGRTLDLQAASSDELAIWTHYFQQVRRWWHLHS